jgi:hypothetical protein
MIIESKPPIVAFYGIEVTWNTYCCVARIVTPDRLEFIGTGNTPQDALYDLCEIVAEFGLDGTRTGYPPSIWQTVRWRVEDVVRSVFRWFE